ncbi:MAG: metallopeptidase family protein [Chloroflexi bacterium]|nr:metallopeptidase family protein [Chloroflexota bacterium]
MDPDAFSRLVSDALDALPAQFRRQIANVAIVVEDWPDEETLDLAGVDRREELLGFYYGIPLTERTHDYGLVPPDKISLFREPILRACGAGEVRDCVRRTLLHELAHYFGIDDNRLEEIGAY